MWQGGHAGVGPGGMTKSALLVDTWGGLCKVLVVWKGIGQIHFRVDAHWVWYMTSSTMSFKFNFSFSISQSESTTRAYGVALNPNSKFGFLMLLLILQLLALNIVIEEVSIPFSTFFSISDKVFSSIFSCFLRFHQSNPSKSFSCFRRWNLVKQYFPSFICLSLGTLHGFLLFRVLMISNSMLSH